MAYRNSSGGNRKAPPEGLAGILRRAFRSHDLEARLPELDLKKRWEEIVGPDLAAFTKPEALRGEELTLLVPSGVWAQEVLGMQREILARIPEKIRGAAPKVLKVRLGKLPRKASLAPATRTLPSVDKLPEETRQHLSQITDEEVREVMTRFVLRHRARTGG